ncbi:MAG: hypothetical protein IKK82_09010 [Kiritimatiellae bacterium]|nr:hypothetical protein [Kiritimatiellia bacterium]
MKRSLNLDLLEFHVREATQELYLLQDAIQYAKDGTRREGAVGDGPVHWPLREGAIAASIEHAYHHLNFAWNGRFKTMQEADAQFNRNEKFPRPHGAVGWFAKFWPRSLIRKRQRKRSASEAQMT